MNIRVRPIRPVVRELLSPLGTPQLDATVVGRVDELRLERGQTNVHHCGLRRVRVVVDVQKILARPQTEDEQHGSEPRHTVEQSHSVPHGHESRNQKVDRRPNRKLRVCGSLNCRKYWPPAFWPPYTSPSGSPSVKSLHTPRLRPVTYRVAPRMFIRRVRRSGSSYERLTSRSFQ